MKAAPRALRPAARDRFPGACPVHGTWPAVCEEYACWRILVLAPNGRRAARVMDSRHIAVDDPALGAALEPPHRDRLSRIVDDADGTRFSPQFSMAPGTGSCGNEGPTGLV